MKKQIVITTWKSQILTALYEDDLLCELWLEKKEQEVRVNDIYIGKVKNVVQNIQAAFVEIMPGVMGYYSLNSNKGHHFMNAKKNDKLVAGDEILVQVEKENLKTKAWTLSSNISFPGRYMLLNSNQNRVLISSRIKDSEEKTRLMDIVKQSEDGNHGWMIRTEAVGQPAEILQEEMKRVLVDYNNVMSTARARTCFTKVHGGDTVYMQTIRKARATGECTVTTDQKDIFDLLSGMFNLPGDNVIMKYYEDSTYPLVKLKGIEAQIDKATQKRVWMKSGAYLVIEPTEALTVIDVNTGKAIGKQNMEDNFYRINMEAAKEVCRQLRLRNISGIVIVDFINMKNPEYLTEVMNYLKTEAAKDAIQTTVVDRTSLHLVEITRKKTRKTLPEQLSSI